MIDREKVIQGLEHCRIMCEGVSHNPCQGCLYQGRYDCADTLKTDALALLKKQQQQIWELQDQVEYLTDKQKEQKFLADSDGKITPLPVVVRCKDCKYRGNSEKCVLSAISEEKDFPLFMLDNRGDWFCADGSRI